MADEVTPDVQTLREVTYSTDIVDAPAGAVIQIKQGAVVIAEYTVTAGFKFNGSFGLRGLETAV